MKILWLCNVAFKDDDLKTTGSWLQPMAEALVNSKVVEIVNVTISANCSYQNTVAGIKQYVIQSHSTGMIAPDSLCKEVDRIIDLEKPDLVHIWGTESVWLSIATKGFIKVKYLLDIQGLLFLCADFYYGNLNFIDCLKSIHLKEILMPWRTLWGKQRTFVKRGKIELQGLKHTRNISYQSEWVRNQLTFVHPTANYHPTKIMLREPFIKSQPWVKIDHGENPVVFTTASGSIPYKGIDVALKAIAELKIFYPCIKLKIAGQMLIGNRMLDGFSVYLKKIIKNLKLEHNVVYLGSIDAEHIVEELRHADATIIPSFVETYCLAFAESMMVGTPTLCAYSGAMPELATNQTEALFYNPSDYRQAAALLKKIIEDDDLSTRLSVNGRNRRLKENNPKSVVEAQLGIYKKILEQ